MAAARAVDSAVVSIRGETAAERALTAPADAELMVFATERGVDVTLEVNDAAGHVVGTGDSPVRRTGVQRVLLPNRTAGRYTIAVTGKEHGDSNGSVEIRVVDLSRSGDSSCVAAQKTLARGDAAYAAGQVVTRALTKTSGASSEKSYQEAAAGYRQAAESLQASGPAPLLAQAQLAEASLLQSELDNFTEAKLWAGQAAKTYSSLSDPYGEARAEAISAAAATEDAVTVRKSGSMDAARQASEMLADARSRLGKVVLFHAGRKELDDQAWAQNFIGLGYYFEGRYDEAIKAYEKALPPYETSHQRYGQVRVLQNVALTEYELGRISDAVPHFRQALKLIKKDENPKLYASVLGNSGLANWAGGNQDLALRQFGESLAIAQVIQDTNVQIVDLHNTASVYATLGDQERALNYYRQALELLSTADNIRLHTGTLRCIANILRQQGDAQGALRMDREALALAPTSATKPKVMVQIAKDLIDLGRIEEADENIKLVLNQSSGADELDRARALLERARLRARSADLAAAEADLKAALPIFKSYEAPIDEFETWLSLAQLADRHGARAEAFAAVDQALALAEEVRLQSANPELRSTLLQPLRPAFDLRIAMLYEQYSAAEGQPAGQAALALRALETAEQARGRALADYQTLDAAAPGLDAALVQRRQTLYRELAARRFRLEASIDRTGNGDLRSRAIRAEIASLRQELDQIDAKIGAASQIAQTRRATAEKSTTLPLDRIPEGVALTEYWLGNPESFAWVVTRNGVTMTRLGPSARIGAEATALHKALRSFGSVPKSERLAASDRLYRLVIGPIEAQLSETHTLIFAADGPLHYVPFATLTRTAGDRKVFLVENHDIAVTPSLHMFLRPAPRPLSPESRRMLLVDDPVYDPADVRVAKSSPSTIPPEATPSGPVLALVRGPGNGRYLPRLPGAAQEAAAISALMPPGNIERLEGFAANRDRFLASDLQRYRLIHVASHASTDPEIPQASALILSTVNGSGAEIDGRVLAADFMGIRLNADTVVLSGCDTALGKSVAGEGLIGLQYIVLARGARSVVSSLWPAIDQVTADVMVRFYSSLLNQRMTVISAWSAASRAMLTRPYADPGTWGAFMLTLSHIEDVGSL